MVAGSIGDPEAEPEAERAQGRQPFYAPHPIAKRPPGGGTMAAQDLVSAYKGWPLWARIAAPATAGLFTLGAIGSLGGAGWSRGVRGGSTCGSVLGTR